jgi:hypothetical protein
MVMPNIAKRTNTKPNSNSYSGRNKEEGTDGPERQDTCQSLCILKYYCNYKYFLYIVD